MQPTIVAKETTQVPTLTDDVSSSSNKPSSKTTLQPATDKNTLPPTTTGKTLQPTTTDSSDSHTPTVEVPTTDSSSTPTASTPSPTTLTSQPIPLAPMQFIFVKTGNTSEDMDYAATANQLQTQLKDYLVAGFSNLYKSNRRRLQSQSSAVFQSLTIGDGMVNTTSSLPKTVHFWFLENELTLENVLTVRGTVFPTVETVHEQQQTLLEAWNGIQIADTNYRLQGFGMVDPNGHYRDVTSSVRGTEGDDDNEDITTAAVGGGLAAAAALFVCLGGAVLYGRGGQNNRVEYILDEELEEENNDEDAKAVREALSKSRSNDEVPDTPNEKDYLIDAMEDHPTQDAPQLVLDNSFQTPPRKTTTKNENEEQKGRSIMVGSMDDSIPVDTGADGALQDSSSQVFLDAKETQQRASSLSTAGTKSSMHTAVQNEEDMDTTNGPTTDTTDTSTAVATKQQEETDAPETDSNLEAPSNPSTPIRPVPVPRGEYVKERVDAIEKRTPSLDEDEVDLMSPGSAEKIRKTVMNCPQPRTANDESTKSTERAAEEELKEDQD